MIIYAAACKASYRTVRFITLIHILMASFRNSFDEDRWQMFGHVIRNVSRMDFSRIISGAI